MNSFVSRNERQRFGGIFNAKCVAPMHLFITTVSPAAFARAAVSSFVTPSCSHRALAPIFAASSAMRGVRARVVSRS